MQKIAFTLIELIIVVIIIGISSYLVVSNVKTATNPIITPEKFREAFYPDKTLYMFRDSFNTKLNISLTNPIVYDKDLNQINFKRYKDKDVLFKYSIHNGIQNSYILECNEGIFVFKPLKTIKVNSLQKAQDILTMKEYMPKEGDFYK